MKIETYYKWKYPNSYNEILNTFNSEELEFAKKSKHKFGRLINQITTDGEIYTPNTLCIWQQSKHFEDGIWTGMFQMYCLVKCNKKNHTISGFNSISTYRQNIIEITK